MMLATILFICSLFSDVCFQVSLAIPLIAGWVLKLNIEIKKTV